MLSHGSLTPICVVIEDCATLISNHCRFHYVNFGRIWTRVAPRWLIAHAVQSKKLQGIKCPMNGRFCGRGQGKGSCPRALALLPSCPPQLSSLKLKCLWCLNNVCSPCSAAFAPPQQIHSGAAHGPTWARDSRWLRGHPLIAHENQSKELQGI